MPWSFTALTKYETCPRLYDAVYNKKKKEPDSESSLWGKRVHKHLEDRVAGKPLPEILQQHETKIGAMIDAAKTAGFQVLAEQRLGLNAMLQPVDFFGATVWYRGVADLTLLGTAYGATFDYKTGRRKDDFTQLELVTCALFQHYEPVTLIDATFLWLQDGKASVKRISRDDAPAIWQRMIPRVRRMENETKFEPTPNGLCRKHCHVTSCEFNGRYGQ